MTMMYETDRLVYHLYGLTYDEVLIVDLKTPITREEYEKQVIKNLSLRLIGRYGSGWSEKKLRHCIRSAETFSEQDIVSSTQRQLKLPDKKLLAQKLKKAIAIAREHYQKYEK